MPEIAHITENYGEIKKFMALSWRAAQLSGVSPTDFVKLAKEFSGAISVSENSIERIYTIDPDPRLEFKATMALPTQEEIQDALRFFGFDKPGSPDEDLDEAVKRGREIWYEEHGR